MTYRCKDCGSTVRGVHKFRTDIPAPTQERVTELQKVMTKLGGDGMDVKQLHFLVRFFESAEFQQHIKRDYDRSFEVIVDEKDKKLRLQFASKDSGQQIMTVQDVAELLQIDRASVRRMTGERAQRRSHHPIPFVKIGGKMLRFSRPAVEAWWNELCASTNGKCNTSALTLTKGKVKKR
jgi:excisionase family DNA binding protein